MVPEDEEDEDASLANKAAWTEAEDAAVLAAVATLGSRWQAVATQLSNGRTADSVRNRWHRLQKKTGSAPGSPPIHEVVTAAEERAAATSRLAWSEKEDQMITAGVKRHGCKWRLLAEMLPGRSDSSIRNRWHRIARRDGLSDPPSSAQASGIAAAEAKVARQLVDVSGATTSACVAPTSPEHQHTLATAPEHALALALMAFASGCPSPQLAPSEES